MLQSLVFQFAEAQSVQSNFQHSMGSQMQNVLSGFSSLIKAERKSRLENYSSISDKLAEAIGLISKNINQLREETSRGFLNNESNISRLKDEVAENLEELER